MHVYEVRPRKDKRGVDLISDALPFGRLWYGDFVPRLSVTPFNGVCGNNRVGSVYGDDAKSRSPERLARALGHGNSLRAATQLGGGARPRYRFCDCGPHSAETDQSGESALLISLISLSLRSQFHFVARPNVGRVYSRSHPITGCRDPRCADEKLTAFGPPYGVASICQRFTPVCQISTAII